jgi:hypothetical protein
MSPAARTVRFFGGYLLAVALVLVLVPNLLLGVLGIPTTSEPWLHVLGVVVGVLGVYYLVAAQHEFTAFIRATVPGRLVAGAGIIVLVALWGYWPAVVFGVVDIAAAGWTASALRSTASRPAAAGTA